MCTDKILSEYGKLKGKNDTLILGIESSCDETAAAVVKGGTEVLSNIIASQISIHQRFGGVVPEIASRNHVLAVNQVVEDAVNKAGVTLNDIDAIAVTYGAGLAGALLVGVSAAKGYAYALKKPLIKVNHIEAHIAANYIEHKELKPPFLAVVASGGHTGIVDVTGYNEFNLLGGTTDDAIGEAFDKVARLLGLPYPGGPSVEKTAEGGTADIEFFKTAKIYRDDLNLSYSGLKTAVVNYVHNLRQKGEPVPIQNICASFTKTAVNMLVNATVNAAKKHGRSTVVLAGGVAANQALRKSIAEKGLECGFNVLYPKLELCTDNASMVAARAFYQAFYGEPPADLSLNAVSNLRITQ